MTAVASRTAPSPTPQADCAPRDVSRNPWVRRPEQSELEDLFGIELVTSTHRLAFRRPKPNRASA